MLFHRPQLAHLVGVIHETVSAGRSWVTTRRLGVAHPICALEMLHHEGSGEGDGEAPDGVEAAAAAAGGPAALRTLRIASTRFSHTIQVRPPAPDPAVTLLQSKLAVLCRLLEPGGANTVG